MIKSYAATVVSRCRLVVSSIRPSSALLQWVPARYLQPAAMIVISVTVIFIYFSPIFEGYTFSDIANRQKGLYPWVHLARDRVAPLHYDQADSFYPWQVFIGRALRSGEVPLWDPLSFAGHPFFANGQNGVFYPPKAYLSLVVSATRVHDALVLSHMLLGGVLMFGLLRRSRLCFGACLFGGLAWMLNSFMLSWMALEHFAVIEAFLPLSFLLVDKVVKGSLPAALGLGVVLAAIFLGGNLLFVELTFVVVALYGIYLFYRRWRRPERKILTLNVPRAVWGASLLGVTAAICLGLIAIQFLPTAEIVRAMDRSVLSFTELRMWRLPVSELRCFLFEPIHEVNTPMVIGEEPYHRMMFLGTPTALLAVIGFWRRHKLVAYLRVLAVVALLAALGTPLTWVAMKLIPGFGHLKPLGRVLFLFNFAAAVLAAFGLDWVLRGLPRLVRWRVRGPGLHLWRLGLSSALAIIVVVQMYSVASWVVRYQSDHGDQLYPETPLIKTLGNDDSTRMLAIHPSFYGSTPMVFGINNAGGYESLLPTRITRLWRVIDGTPVDSVIKNPPAGAFATTFGYTSRFDLLPRVSVTHVVAPPVFSVVGCRGELDQPSFVAKNVPPGAERNVVAGDWDGDGLDSVGFYDPNSREFLLWKSNSSDSTVEKFHPSPAEPNWVPLAGDWNGDGRDSVGLYDRDNGTFHLYELSGSHQEVKFGPAGTNWIPIAGDWDGNREDTVGLFDWEKGHFHLQNSLKPKPDSTNSFPFGFPGEHGIPVMGDWDGDRSETIGLYYPGHGAVYARNFNTAGAFDLIIKWGPHGKELIPLAGYWYKDVSRARMDVLALYDPADRNVYLCKPSFFGKADLTRTYSGVDGDIYAVKDPLPRAYVVYGTETVDDANAALRRFSDPAFDATKSVIVEADQFVAAGMPPPATEPPGSAPEMRPAQVVSRSLNTISIHLDAERDGWLVVTESWEKGWRATLDGVPTTLLPGNYTFRAVRVPAGEHVVDMTYKPRSYAVGKAVSLSTLGIVLVLFGAGHIRRLRHRNETSTQAEASFRQPN